MREKTVSPPQGAQASEGQVRQVSQLFGEAIGDTHEWIEIHRTGDEWEANLIQTTLKAQQIQCRPIELKENARQHSSWILSMKWQRWNWSVVSVSLSRIMKW